MQVQSSQTPISHAHLLDWRSAVGDRKVGADARTKETDLRPHPGTTECVGCPWLRRPTWVAKSLADGIICLPGVTESPMDQNIDLSSVVKFAHEQNFRVLVAFSNLIGRQLEQYPTEPMGLVCEPSLDSKQLAVGTG